VNRKEGETLKKKGQRKEIDYSQANAPNSNENGSQMDLPLRGKA